MDEHRTTTPRWLRLPALILLFSVAVYFLAGFHFAMEDSKPRWVWMGVWSMFTGRDRTQNEVRAEALIEGEWHQVELDVLFPYRWESGRRFERRNVYGSGRRLKALASATCTRLSERPQAVRFQRASWRKRLGDFDQSPAKESVKNLGEFSCGVRP
ncbi:MAG: hypothetical protein AB8H79_08570 [Myxococcota bacterium]